MAELKQLARRILHQTLAAIDIPLTMQRKLAAARTVLRCGDAAIDVCQFHKIYVVAIGKAAHAMVEGLTDACRRIFLSRRSFLTNYSSKY